MVMVIGVSAQASIIWNFDTLSPATILHNGYFYVYTYANTKGIGGSSALYFNAPYEGIDTADHSFGFRHSGGGLWLSNLASFALNSVPPYNSPIGNTTSNLNLSATPTIYFSIKASTTSNFGIAFTAYDTSGRFFVTNGSAYLTDSANLRIAHGGVSTTSFQQVSLNLANTHPYVYVPYATATTGTPPALANIQAMWIFLSTVSKYSTSGGPGLTFYIDNIGATSGSPKLPTSIYYSDWSIFSESVIAPSKDQSAVIKE